MANKDTEQKIKQAFSNAVPDIRDSILSDCKSQKGAVIIMTDTNKRTFSPRRLAGIAAAFVLLIGGMAGFQTYRTNYSVASTVSLDVNPSIEIQVNKKEEVLAVNPRNEDAQIVVGDMDFKGSNLDVAVNALIGSMLRNGYLNELANSILISVDNQDPAKSAELQERLANEINAVLQSGTFDGAVLSQSISADSKLRELADTYGITLGKAQLIQQITQQSAFYSFEDLVPLSINELNLLTESGNLNLANVSSLGTASDKAYIGQEKAKQAAISHAGASADKLTEYEIELDFEHGVMVYEVEFKCEGFEYDYEIDAITGAVLKSEKEPDDDYVRPGPTPPSRKQAAPLRRAATRRRLTTALLRPITAIRLRQIKIRVRPPRKTKIQKLLISAKSRLKMPLFPTQVFRQMPSQLTRATWIESMASWSMTLTLNAKALSMTMRLMPLPAPFLKIRKSGTMTTFRPSPAAVRLPAEAEAISVKQAQRKLLSPTQALQQIPFMNTSPTWMMSMGR